MKKRTSKRMVHNIKTNYLDSIYTRRFTKLVPKTINLIKTYRRKHDFDAIAFTGSSGAALAYPASFLLKIPLIHVRKSDGSHYQDPIEGSMSSKRYLIVDDMISSGYTVNRIISTIKDNYKHYAKPVGICLFNSPPCSCGECDLLKYWNFGPYKVPIIRVPEVK